MNNDQEFELFWQTFQWPVVKPIFYRLYYDDQGNPISYSMEELPGKYIEITAEQYQKSNPHVVVRNGQLIEKTFFITKKLIPAADGTACCPDNVAIVVDPKTPNIKWKLTSYEHN